MMDDGYGIREGKVSMLIENRKKVHLRSTERSKKMIVRVED